MPNIAEIEGVIGPGIHSKITLNEVTSVKFDFGHNTLEVETKDGKIAVYDMSEVGEIATTNEKGNYLIKIKQKKTEEQGHAGEVKKTDTGPVKVGDKDASAAIPHKADFPPAPKK